MHYVKAKGILSSQNGMNLYRGCTHGCIYCDSRSSCYRMDHSFEDIEVKENALELLEDALNFCRERGLEFYAVNSNYPQGALFKQQAGRSCKVVADLYIDDRNVGGLPDWGTIHEIVTGVREAKHKAHRKRKFKLFRR